MLATSISLAFEVTHVMAAVSQATVPKPSLANILTAHKQHARGDADDAFAVVDGADRAGNVGAVGVSVGPGSFDAVFFFVFFGVAFFFADEAFTGRYAVDPFVDIPCRMGMVDAAVDHRHVNIYRGIVHAVDVSGYVFGGADAFDPLRNGLREGFNLAVGSHVLDPGDPRGVPFTSALESSAE